MNHSQTLHEARKDPSNLVLKPEYKKIWFL